MKKRVLLLDERDDMLAVSVARCLQLASGYEVHCLSGSADSVLRHSKHCRVQHVPWDTPASLLSAVAAYVEKEAIDVIIPIQEVMIVMAGRVAEQIERLAPLAPMPDPATCSRLDDKWSFHLMMEEAGVPVPRATLATEDPASLRSELSGWNSPVLLKPTLAWGGRGIRLFERPGDLLKALDDSPPEVTDEFFIEEFIPGGNVSCNFLSVDGEIIAHTVQRSVLNQAAEFSSAGLGVQFIHDDPVVAIAAKLAEVSRWSGVVNLNLRIDSRTGKPVVIEANPRYWQTVLASLAMGVNYPDLHCRLAIGDSPTAAHGRTGFYLDVHSLLTSPRNVLTLVTHDPGFLRHIHPTIVAADPRLDVALVYRTLKRTITWAVAGASQFGRRVVGGQGRSGQPG